MVILKHVCVTQQYAGGKKLHCKSKIGVEKVMYMKVVSQRIILVSNCFFSTNLYD